MPKQVYCSKCGMELIQARVALKNRGVIITTIEPHECDDSFLENIVDAEKPAKEVLDLYPSEQTPLSEAESDPDSSGLDWVMKDKRDPKHQRSTAPQSVIDKVKPGGDDD